MRWGKGALGLVMTGALGLGLAGCGHEPPFENLEQMRQAAVDAGATGCGADDAYTPDMGNGNLVLGCTEGGLGMYLYKDASEEEIFTHWTRLQQEDAKREVESGLGLPDDQRTLLLGPRFLAVMHHFNGEDGDDVDSVMSSLSESIGIEPVTITRQQLMDGVELSDVR